MRDSRLLTVTAASCHRVLVGTRYNFVSNAVIFKDSSVLLRLSKRYSAVSPPSTSRKAPVT